MPGCGSLAVVFSIVPLSSQPPFLLVSPLLSSLLSSSSSHHLSFSLPPARSVKFCAAHPLWLTFSFICISLFVTSIHLSLIYLSTLLTSLRFDTQLLHCVLPYLFIISTPFVSLFILKFISSALHRFISSFLSLFYRSLSFSFLFHVLIHLVGNSIQHT